MKLPKYALTNLKILIAIPTYKRVGNVITLPLFDDPTLFVDTSELDLYKKEYPNTKIIEYTGSAGLTPKLNFILDYARANNYDAIWKIDDDFTAMGCFSKGYAERITDPAYIYQVIERMCLMAKEAGTPLFYNESVADIRRYYSNKPFGFFSTLKLGAYGLLLDNDLRFDERLVMKQDIDMCCQVLLNYRYVFMENRYSFWCKHTMGNKGGVASYRSKEKEEKMMDILRKKWGDNVFNLGSSKNNSIYTLNISNPFS